MKEAIEEFGATMIVCIIGAIVLTGTLLLINNNGILIELANKYAEYFH